MIRFDQKWLMESCACRKFVIPRASLSSIYSAHRISRFNGIRSPVDIITDKTYVNIVWVVPNGVIINHKACHVSIVVVSDENGNAKYSFDAFSWRTLKDPMNCIVNAMSILALVLVRACARLLLIWRGSRGRISRSSNNSLEHSHWLPLLWNLAVDFYPF